MIWLICILAGIVAGNHIKVSVSPELTALLTSSWRLANEKALPVANLAAKKIKSAAAKSVKSTGKTTPAISIVEFTEDDFEGKQ
jgi:hypothetical protein